MFPVAHSPQASTRTFFFTFAAIAAKVWAEKIGDRNFAVQGKNCMQLLAIAKIRNVEMTGSGATDRGS